MIGHQHLMLNINNCATLFETSNHVVHYLTTLANFYQRQWGTIIAFCPPNIACSLSHVAFHIYNSITPFCKCSWVGVLSWVMSYFTNNDILQAISKLLLFDATHSVSWFTHIHTSRVYFNISIWGAIRMSNTPMENKTCYLSTTICC